MTTYRGTQSAMISWVDQNPDEDLIVRKDSNGPKNGKYLFRHQNGTSNSEPILIDEEDFESEWENNGCELVDSIDPEFTIARNWFVIQFGSNESAINFLKRSKGLIDWRGYIYSKWSKAGKPNI